MKRAILLVCVLTLSVAIRRQDQKQSQWDNYKPRTLKSIVETCCPPEWSSPSTKTYIDLPGDFPSQVKLVYLGQSRPLPTSKKELLTHWAKSRHPERPQRFVEMFPTELLFKEDTEEHWVAVQKPLLKPLPKKVKPGQIFNSYVMLIGTIHKIGEEREWLFVMNEFDAPVQSK